MGEYNKSQTLALNHTIKIIFGSGKKICCFLQDFVSDRLNVFTHLELIINKTKFCKFPNNCIELYCIGLWSI